MTHAALVAGKQPHPFVNMCAWYVPINLKWWDVAQAPLDSITLTLEVL